MSQEFERTEAHRLLDAWLDTEQVICSHEIFECDACSGLTAWHDAFNHFIRHVHEYFAHKSGPLAAAANTEEE